MPGYRRSTHSLIVLFLLALCFAMAAPAGVAAQGNDDEDATTTIAPQGDHDNEAPPDCDEGGWRIVTTEDGDGFASEDRCDDHVAEHGEDSLVEVGADEVDEYVVVTMAEALGPYCQATATLVDGQDGQVVSAVITAASGGIFLPTLIVATGDTSQSALIRQGDSLVSGTAEFLDSDWNPTGETLPVYLPTSTCE